jgi:phospholipid transport system substrate-binding protein
MIRALFFVFFAFGYTNAAVESITEEEARNFINTLGKDALSALTKKELSQKKRESEFSSILDRGFDVKAMGRFCLGRYWRNFNKEQRKQYFVTLKNMLIRSYVGKFANFPGANFRISKIDISSDLGATVLTAVDCPGSGSFNVGWRLYKAGERGIRITDVVVDGISMSITQRSEFVSVMSGVNNNVEEFIKRLSKVGEK